MSLSVKKGYAKLVADAENEVESLTPAQVDERLRDESVLLVDLRDIRELKREGKIPGAFHVPRGMLEFWIDPDSPYYQSRFDDAASLILYCNKGWRSALAARTLQDMGIEHVSHMAGGMERWREEIGRIEDLADKR